MASDRDKINLQYDRQQELAREQNEWQSQENALDAQRQYDYWRSMFSEQNEYNKPSSQVARLQAAGINPSALASQMGGMISPGSGGSGSGPVSSHSVQPFNYTAPLGVSSDAALFSSMAQLNDSLSKLSQTGLNVERQKALLGHEVENVVADTASKRESATQTSLNNEILSIYGKSKAGAEITKMLDDAYASRSRGDFDKAHELYVNALERLSNDDRARKNKAWPVVLANLRKQGELMDSEILRNQSASAESRSRASYMSSLTETENYLRQGKFDAQELSNKLLDVQRQMQGRENVRDMQTSAFKVQAIVDQCEREGLLNRQSKQILDKMITDNQWNNVEHCVGVLGNIVGSVGSAASAGAALRSAGAAVDRNAVSREFNSYLRDHWNGESFTEEQIFSPDGRLKGLKQIYKTEH